MRPRCSFVVSAGLSNPGSGSPPPIATRVLEAGPYDRIVHILSFGSGRYGLTRDSATQASALQSVGGVTALRGVRIPRGNELWWGHVGNGDIAATFIVTELPEGA